MSELNRRDLLRRTAVGAALAGTASAAGANAAALGPTTAAGAGAPGVAVHGVAAVARARDVDVVPPGDGRVELALVTHARSLSREVYLTTDGTRRGFVELGPEAFAIAVACQAAGRPVAALCWGHVPAACGGAGRFAGALLAVDPLDLPGRSGAEA